MNEQENQTLIEEAVEDYRGLFVRKLPKDLVADRLLRILPNQLLIAITGRSANQVTRFKKGAAQPNLGDVDKIYAFYKEVSGMPIPSDGSENPTGQMYLYYTTADGQAVVNQAKKFLDVLDVEAKAFRRELMHRVRRIRDEAPSQLPDVYQASDGTITVGEQATTMKQDAEFLQAQQQQEKAEQTAEKYEPKQYHLYNAEDESGQSLMSTDKRQWFYAPVDGDGASYGEADLPDALGFFGDTRPIYGQLTMLERVIFETVNLADPDYETLDGDPKHFWKEYAKLGKDNQDGRKEMGLYLLNNCRRNNWDTLHKLGKVTDLETIQIYAQKMMKYYLEHREALNKQGIDFEHDAKTMQLVPETIQEQ